MIDLSSVALVLRMDKNRRRREWLEDRICDLDNSFGVSQYQNGQVRDLLARYRAELAQLKAEPGDGGAA